MKEIVVVEIFPVDPHCKIYASSHIMCMLALFFRQYMPSKGIFVMRERHLLVGGSAVFLKSQMHETAGSQVGARNVSRNG